MESKNQSTAVDTNTYSPIERGTVPQPFSNSTFFDIEIVLGVLVTGLLAVFGIVTNAVNMDVFRRQGVLSHSCNASLFGMALADFTYSVHMLAGSICLFCSLTTLNPLYTWVAIGFYAFLGQRPSVIFSDVTSAITAYVAIERAVSVTLPFKVKSIFTPKRSGILIICIFLVSIIDNLPICLEFLPVWRMYYLERGSNIMVRRLNYLESNIFPENYPRIAGYVDVSLRALWFCTVLVCNAILSFKVRLSEKFRKSAAKTADQAQTSSNAKGENPIKTKSAGTAEKPQKDSTTSNKEIKLVRMISVVCTVFSLCFFSELLIYLVFNLMEEYYDYHPYTRKAATNVAILLQQVNATINIVIYYSLSSRYRTDLRLLLRIKEG